MTDYRIMIANAFSDMTCAYSQNKIIMASARFEIHNIDPLYIDSAIQDMNQETAKGFNNLYQHIEEWRTYGQVLIDMMRMRVESRKKLLTISFHAHLKSRFQHCRR